MASLRGSVLILLLGNAAVSAQSMCKSGVWGSGGDAQLVTMVCSGIGVEACCSMQGVYNITDEADGSGGAAGGSCFISAPSGFADIPGSLPVMFPDPEEACKMAGGNAHDTESCGESQAEYTVDDSFCRYDLAVCCDEQGMACDCKDEQDILVGLNTSCLDFDFSRHGAAACDTSLNETFQSLACWKMDTGDCDEVVAELAGTFMEDMHMQDLCPGTCGVCGEPWGPPVEGLCANEEDLEDLVLSVHCLNITKEKCCEIGGHVFEHNASWSFDQCDSFQPDFDCLILATESGADAQQMCSAAGGNPMHAETCMAQFESQAMAFGASCTELMRGSQTFWKMRGCCGAGAMSCEGQGPQTESFPMCASESDFTPDSRLEVRCLNLDSEACCSAGGSLDYPDMDSDGDWTEGPPSFCAALLGTGSVSDSNEGPWCTFRMMGDITDPEAACNQAGGIVANDGDQPTCDMLQMALRADPSSRDDICSGGQATIRLFSNTCCGGGALHEDFCPEVDVEESLCPADDTLLADQDVIVTCDMTLAKCCELGQPTAGLSVLTQDGCAMLGATSENVPCDLLATYHPGVDLTKACTDNGGTVSDTLTCQAIEENVLALTGGCQDWPLWAPALADMCCSSGVSICRQLPPDEDLDMGRALCEDMDLSREDIGASPLVFCGGLTREKCCEVGGLHDDQTVSDDQWADLANVLSVAPMDAICKTNTSSDFAIMGPMHCYLEGKDAEEVCTSNGGAAVLRETCFDRMTILFEYIELFASSVEARGTGDYVMLHVVLRFAQLGCCPDGKAAKELPSWFPQVPGQDSVAEELCMDETAFQDVPLGFFCDFADGEKCCLAGGEMASWDHACAGQGVCEFSGQQVLPAHEMCEEVGGTLTSRVYCREAWWTYRSSVNSFWEEDNMNVEDVCDHRMDEGNFGHHLRFFDVCCMGGDEDTPKGAKCDPLAGEGMAEAAESFCGDEEGAFAPDAHPAVTCVGLTKEVCCSQGWEWMNLASIDDGVWAAPNCSSKSADGDNGCVATGPSPVMACKIAGGYPKMPAWSRCLETLTGYADFTARFDGDFTCQTIVDDETGMSAESMLGMMTFDSHACCRNGKTLCQMPAERTSPVNYCANADSMNHHFPLIVECKNLGDDKCTEVGGTVDAGESEEPSMCQVEAGSTGTCSLDASDGSVMGSPKAICLNEGGFSKTLYTCADFWESPKFQTFSVAVEDIEAAAGDEDALCAIEGITDLFDYAASLGCCTDRLPMCGPKTSPAREPVVVSDKITGLDFSAVESDPELKEHLTTTFQSTYAEEFGVPQDDVEVSLSAGSIIVTATIKTTEATEAFVKEKAEEVTAQAAAGGASSMATALIAVVTAAPGIEKAIQPGMAIGVELGVLTATTTTAEATTTAEGEDDDDDLDSQSPPSEGDRAPHVAGALLAKTAAILAMATAVV